MSSNTYTLHQYDHHFDGGLARMWNESDDQWPGTFTDGVPLTEERVGEWMDRIETLVRFIAVEDQTGKVVGYGDLWDTAVRPKSCYVALLNVHPEHQGRSLARRMLVEMVDWAVENGYDRVTIGTWPANLKAMPLYKKVGFFWKPNTSVYMENYLPGARLLPAAQEFFAQHDWYSTYKRDLSQVEDGQKNPCTGDMDVYTLRWQEGDAYLETIFDRNAQALTGIQTEKWTAVARTRTPEPGKGLRYPFEWEFFNKTDRPLQVLLEADADAGIEFLHHESFELAPQTARTIRKEFRVALDAPKYQGHHEDIPTPRVRSRLQLNGTRIELGTGLRYDDALELSIFPVEASLAPGVPQEVLLQVHNRTKVDLEGALNLVLPEGLTADWDRKTFHLPAEGHAGLPVTLTARSGGFYPMQVRPETTQTGVLDAKLLPVTALLPGSWTAGVGDEELILENDFFRIAARSRSGEAIIFNKDTHEEEARMMEEIGPAYVPWDLFEQEYELNLQQSEGEAKAVMTVRSTRFPGVIVGREIAINASPIIRVRGWVTNNGDTALEGLHLRPHIRVQYENRKHVAAALKDGLVREHGSQFGTNQMDLPKKIDRYEEPWIAYEENGRAFGFIWEEKALTEVLNESGRHYFFCKTPLQPGDTHRGAPMYLYCGPGDWRTVRQTWRRLSGKSADRRPVTPQDAAGAYLRVTAEKSPLFTLTGDVETNLKIENMREYMLHGTLKIQPPQGWSASPAEIAFEVDRENPKIQPLRLRAEADTVPGPYRVELIFESQVFDRTVPLDVFLLGDAGRRVDVRQHEADRLWTVDNGRCRWTLAPDFHGGVIAWQLSGHETNHLLTSYPDEGELSWMKPSFGGIRPVLFDLVKDSGWPGKLHNERFTTSRATLTDAQGLTWSGVRISTDVQTKPFTGIRVELDYLTLPGAGILKTVYRLVNDTFVYSKAQFGWLTFAQVGGSHQHGVLHTPDYIRKRTPHNSWGLHEGWAAIEDPATGLTLAAVPASGRRSVQAIDMGSFGAHFFVRENKDIAPSAETELAAYFVLTDSIQHAGRYANPGKIRG